MREIRNPDTDRLYMTVEVNEKLLTMHLEHPNVVINLDAKVIPQLANILKEAEFFKVV